MTRTHINKTIGKSQSKNNIFSSEVQLNHRLSYDFVNTRLDQAIVLKVS